MGRSSGGFRATSVHCLRAAVGQFKWTMEMHTK